jgi:hypothetical protein
MEGSVFSFVYFYGKWETVGRGEAEFVCGFEYK